MQAVETVTDSLKRQSPMLAAYIQAALWSSAGDDGEPLDKKYDCSGLSQECLVQFTEDCLNFQRDNEDDIGTELEQAGHDFWLTRNGHGAGFWDGDWQDEVGQRLTAASKAYGSCDLYIGDDGKIHCS